MATGSGSSRPCQGLFRDSEAEAAPSTTARALGSTSTRLAGSPTASGRPCPASRAIRAGAYDIRSATCAQSSRPLVTIVSITTASAVSRPSMPGAASTKACSLSCRACGAWSVPTAAIVPSARASRSAATCSSGRSGGFTLYVGS